MVALETRQVADLGRRPIGAVGLGAMPVGVRLLAEGADPPGGAERLHGCRDATELTGGEAVMGFPGTMLEPLVLQLEHLCAKAMPASRGKGALAALRAQATR